MILKNVWKLEFASFRVNLFDWIDEIDITFLKLVNWKIKQPGYFFSFSFLLDFSLF